MSEPIHDKIKQSIQAAKGLYYRLVLLVGSTGSGKTKALQALAEELGTPVINVNLELSGQLLELTVKQRALRLPTIFGDIINIDKELILLDNLELLFDITLKQDPLRLLRGVSRNRVVVASWNGKYSNGVLSYASQGHPEYRSYDSIEELIVEMDGAPTANPAINGTEALQA